MKRVLITGAAGFVGANLTHRLVAEGHQITAFVRPGSDLWRLNSITAELDVQSVDLNDADAIPNAVRQAAPDWIFHLAVHGAYSWQNDSASIVSTNLTGTQRLLETCAKEGFESFVNVGSSSEYGYADHPPKEHELPKPNSYYAFAKAAATMFCRFFAEQNNLPVRTLRLYSAYGPWEDNRRLIPTLIAAAREGKLPPLVDPDVARDYVFVEDVIDALVLAAGKPCTEYGEVLNVGTGIQTTIREIVDVVRSLFQISVEPVWGSMPNRRWDTTSWVADNGKIATSLGWAPKVPLRDGLEITSLRSDATNSLSFGDSLKV
jgi:UDP-glucose 4-epimerase